MICGCVWSRHILCDLPYGAICCNPSVPYVFPEVTCTTTKPWFHNDTIVLSPGKYDFGGFVNSGKLDSGYDDYWGLMLLAGDKLTIRRSFGNAGH